MKVLIAIPTLNSVPIEFFMSILGLKMVEDTEVSIVANSLVYQARNQLALKAIDEGYDYVLWLDSDMVFASDTLTRLLDDAEKYKVDYVAGLAFWRHKPTNPVIYKRVLWGQNKDGTIEHGAEIWKDYPKDKFFEIGGSGMGCVLVRTSVIRKVAETFKCSPFEPMPFMSEDLSFCWRLARLGFPMYCDSRIKVGHVGQYIFDEAFYLEQENENTGRV